MKKYYPLFFLLAFFLSSCDRRFSIATTFIEDSVEQQNIDVLSTDFDSIAIPMHDSNTLKRLFDYLYQCKDYTESLSNYKKTHFDGQSKVWMRAMTDKELSTYNKLNNQRRVLELYSLWSIFHNALPDKEKHTSIWIKYKKENSETIKYGVFYFNEKGEIKNHIIFNEDIYITTKELVDSYKKRGAAPDYTIPDFDSIGLDIVPVDEDPTKTKAERKAIKEKEEEEKRIREEKEKKEKEAKERAEMMRTNPILRTFYGATLGTKSVRTIVNQLKNKGYTVEDYGSGQYFCQNYYDYFEGASWDNIRIYSANGRLTMVVLEEDFRLGPNARKRYFHDEVIDFYNSIKRFYREKYSFWSTSYDGSEYEDDKTKLKIDHDDGYSVWATYTLNE